MYLRSPCQVLAVTFVEVIEVPLKQLSWSAAVGKACSVWLPSITCGFLRSLALCWQWAMKCACLICVTVWECVWLVWVCPVGGSVCDSCDVCPVCGSVCDSCDVCPVCTELHSQSRQVPEDWAACTGWCVQTVWQWSTSFCGRRRSELCTYVMSIPGQALQ